MGWFGGSSFWVVLRRWLRTSERLSDPADMGTAFGLDASLMPSEHFPPDPAPDAGVNAGWERRLVRRGRR